MNLLNYPARERQRRWRHHWITGLAGGVVGLLVSWVGAQWTTSQVVQMKQEAQRLQTKLEAQKQDLQAHQKRQSQQGVWVQQVQHLKWVEQQHQAWETLYENLQREAQDGVLQWVSLQWTSGRLELQGRARNFQIMDQVRQRMSQELGQDLRVSSALMVPQLRDTTTPAPQAGPLWLESEVAFVWHGEWPMISRGPEKAPVEGLDSASKKSLP